MDRVELTEDEYQVFRRMIHELGRLESSSQRHICAALSDEIKQSSISPKSWPQFSALTPPLR